MHLRIIVLNERSQAKIVHTYLSILFTSFSRKFKLIYSVRKQNSGCLAMAGKWEGGSTKEHKETFGGDRYVYYLCCADDFTAV